VLPSAQVDANKANNRRYVDEALNSGILDVIDETRGELAEHAKMKVEAWRTAFPDFHTTIETLVAEDDWVAYHVRHEGTHEGEFEAVAPPASASSSGRWSATALRMESSWRTGDCTTTQASWRNSGPSKGCGTLGASATYALSQTGFPGATGQLRSDGERVLHTSNPARGRIPRRHTP